MQYLQEWRGGRDKRKRRAEEESNQESSRKRSRDDAGNDNNNDGGRRESIAIAIAMGAVKEKEKEKDSEQKQEFKIRGSAITPTLNGKSNDWLHLHPSSPFPESRKDRSPSSPLATADPSPSCIHPDRLANISVSTRPLQDKTEHINDAEAGEQICK